jgi:hypothetical protein
MRRDAARFQTDDARWAGRGARAHADDGRSRRPDARCAGREARVALPVAEVECPLERIHPTDAT